MYQRVCPHHLLYVSISLLYLMRVKRFHVTDGTVGCVRTESWRVCT